MPFNQNYNSGLQTLSFWKSLKFVVWERLETFGECRLRGLTKIDILSIKPPFTECGSTIFFILNLLKETYPIPALGLVISVYLSSLPVAHLSDDPRRRLVVTGNSARIQDETTESSTWFFNVLGVKHRHTGPRFNVSSERLLVILVGQPGIRPHNLVTRNIVFTSPMLFLGYQAL